ncbi:flavodoxin domain-containing protein [Clostridium sp. AWRP]|uniref:flavodoxin domain-containing protein n=1 Tax=Clostridium sp. AWRP TaxID=2212991 RepID=UPI001FAA10A6|nr:flavodoxin domain-containing protein [Clostridium sp. AWRP]
MKALILFATKSASTKECAEILAEKFNCPAYNLAEKIPDIMSFDILILGTGVRLGKIYKPALNFIRRNIVKLTQKKIAIFFCNTYPNTFDNAIEKNLPLELIQQAICIKSFGGKPPFTNPQNMDWLNKENLNDFIATIVKYTGDYMQE